MLSFLSMFIIACAGNDNANASGSTGTGSNEVHTQGANFAQSSITITKGSMLTLIDDDSTLLCDLLTQRYFFSEAFLCPQEYPLLYHYPT